MLTFRLATLNVHLFQSSLFFHNNIFDLVSIYGECHKDLFETGIASRYPIASSFHIASTPCEGEMKCLLQCSLDGFDKLTFAVTLVQLKEKDNGCIFVYLCVRQ
jgi:hypothetical protein